MDTKNIITWVLSIALAGLFIKAGLHKIMTPEDFTQDWQQWGIGKAWVTVVGVLEILGAIGVLIPKIAGIPALSLGILMLIAAAICFSNGQPDAGWFSVVAFVLSAAVLWLRKETLTFLIDD